MGRVRKAVGGRVAGTNEGSAGLIQQTHSQEPQAAVDHSSVFWLTRSENSCRARVHVTRNHTRQPHIPNTEYSIQHYLTYKHLHVLERKRKFLQRKTHLKFTLFCGFSWKLTLKTWLCRLLTLACQCFLSVISWQAVSVVGNVRRQPWCTDISGLTDCSNKQSAMSGHGTRLRLVLSANTRTVNTFPVDWPRLFMCTYRHGNLYRFTASLSLSHTVTSTRLSSTHIPTVQSTFRAEGIRVYLTQRGLLCIRNPWFTWLSPPRSVLYCRMNGVTSRQCQGEGNVSVPPWWAFPRSVSLRLMTPAWRALPQPGRAQRRWSEGEEHADCNHRQSSALSPWILATLDRTAWPQTCDLSFKLRVRQKKKEKEENNNEDL